MEHFVYKSFSVFFLKQKKSGWHVHVIKVGNCRILQMLKAFMWVQAETGMFIVEKYVKIYLNQHLLRGPWDWNYLDWYKILQKYFCVTFLFLCFCTSTCFVVIFHNVVLSTPLISPATALLVSICNFMDYTTI